MLDEWKMSGIRVNVDQLSVAATLLGEAMNKHSTLCTKFKIDMTDDTVYKDAKSLLARARTTIAEGLFFYYVETVKSAAKLKEAVGKHQKQWIADGVQMHAAVDLSMQRVLAQKKA